MITSNMPSLDGGAAWIIYYFMANLGLTIHNKWVLKELNFDFPWLLTALHIGVSGLGASFLIYVRGYCKPARISGKDRTNLFLFSFLYTVNIAISNVSLNFVSLAFHQIVRSSTPFFTVMLEMLILQKFHTSVLYFSLIPVVGGVVISTLGDYKSAVDFNALGVFLTVLGVLLSALKTIVTNMMMSGHGKISLHPLDLLHKLAPLAFLQCIIYAFYFGEMSGAHRFVTSPKNSSAMVSIFFNGLMAFWLNWVSFTANKKTSALTMTVAGNVKQAMSIILAIHIFNTVVGPLNILGIFVTLAGGAWYSYVSFREKTSKESQVKQVPKSQSSVELTDPSKVDLIIKP